MEIQDRASTGLAGFDRVIDDLRLGDNVVWQVESVSAYKKIVGPFAVKAVAEERKLIYARFGDHEPLLENNAEIKVYDLNASKGFESFATEVHNMVRQEGRKAERLCFLPSRLPAVLPCGELWKSFCVSTSTTSAAVVRL